ncbi:MAG TPA: CHAD domain-containing protein [Thermoplasmata archaeon]|nr:CHAD domain-containing protein [Thermoplasmata archaeon]
MSKRPRRRLREPGASGATSPIAPVPGGFSIGPAALRIADSTGRDAVRISVASDPTPEQLHRFHQRLRRLRGAVRIAASLLPRAHEEIASEVDRRLRRVARLVGEVRDFDVAAAHLSDPRLTTSPEPPGALLETEVRRLREEARTGRALLGAFLRSEIDRGLFREAEEILRSSPRRLRGPGAWRACRSAVKWVRSRLERALKKARRRGDPDRMHRLRMELRRAHLVSDFIDAAVGRRESSYPGRLARLQRALGTLHDLDLLMEGLEALGARVSDSEWIRREDRRRRALRKRLTSEVGRRSTKFAIASLAP